MSAEQERTLVASHISSGPWSGFGDAGPAHVSVGACLSLATNQRICSGIGVDRADADHLTGPAPRCSSSRLQTTRGYPGSRHGRYRPTRDMARDIPPTSIALDRKRPDLE